MTTFAQQVLKAAEMTPAAGRFAGKVWVHAAWAISGTDMSLSEWKLALLEAHRAGTLTLSRCDLAEACDPYDVKRSRVEYMGATFNLIRV